MTKVLAKIMQDFVRSRNFISIDKIMEDMFKNALEQTWKRKLTYKSWYYKS